MTSILELQRDATCSRYDPQAYLALCHALIERGEMSYAAGIFDRWVHIDPDNPVIAFYRSALLGDKLPEKMPAVCVQHEFDVFAHSFDSVLARLQYSVPTMFAALLATHLDTGAHHRTVDLGCGTGLTGIAAKPFASCLTGVDLSEAMLDRARDRGIYNQLVRADLCDFLQIHPIGFDLAIAGDSLIYTGNLLPIFEALHKSLCSNGLFMFSLEVADMSMPYALGRSGRFVHSETYVRALLNQSGFTVLSLDKPVLRMESGCDVEGMLVVARCLPRSPQRAQDGVRSNIPTSAVNSRHDTPPSP